MLPSAFEVLGPVMVGPSSSHTAGALRLARVAREIAPGRVSSVEFTLYNSFAKTYLGHGTDKALVAGMLGLDTDDGRIRDSFSLAAEQGLAFSFRTSDEGTGLHPNTVDIAMGLADGGSLTVRGESVGGGRVRLSAVGGVAVDVAGEYPTLFVHHGDRPGVLARLTGALSAASINIATIRTFRDARGGDAYTVAELDEALPAELVDAVGAAPGVIFATSLTIPGALPVAAEGPQGPDFSCGADLLALCRERHASIGSVMREREACLAVGGARAADETMGRVRRAMEVSVRATVERPERSLGGFLHGQARAHLHAAQGLGAGLRQRVIIQVRQLLLLAAGGHAVDRVGRPVFIGALFRHPIEQPHLAAVQDCQVNDLVHAAGQLFLLAAGHGGVDGTAALAVALAVDQRIGVQRGEEAIGVLHQLLLLAVGVVVGGQAHALHLVHLAAGQGLDLAPQVEQAVRIQIFAHFNSSSISKFVIASTGAGMRAMALRRPVMASSGC